MTLNELLTTLAENEGLNVEVVETVSEADNVIIDFDASGYEALSAELLAREVEKVTINSQSSIVIGITIKVI